MGVTQLIVVALTSLLLASCGDAGQGSRGEIAQTTSFVADTNPIEWREGATIAIENVDTLSRRDISIFVRHQAQHNLESVEVRIYTSSPDHTIHCDELTIALDNSSKGRRSSLKINNLLYRQDVVWSQRGVYNIDLFPLTPTEGVEAIGVEIKTYRDQNIQTAQNL
ncbi:MAG: hypothetical protein R3Y68_00245 [Rikenellaceae bacterium]